jgi:hypothetical protein
MFTEEQQQQVKNLFDQLPSAKLYGEKTEEIKLINLSILTTLVEKMATQSYTTGKMDGLDSAQSAIQSAFSY